MKLFLAYLILLLCLTGTAYASDSYSFPVSCTIPAIPGVNVPLIAKVETESQPAPQATQQSEETTVTQTSTRDSQTLLVTTIYDR